MHLGRPHAARESLEHALPAMESVHAASQQTFIGFIADPEVTVLAMLGFQLAHLGLIGKCASACGRRTASARARTTDGADGHHVVRRAL